MFVKASTLEADHREAEADVVAGLCCVVAAELPPNEWPAPLKPDALLPLP